MIMRLVKKLLYLSLLALAIALFTFTLDSGSALNLAQSSSGCETLSFTQPAGTPLTAGSLPRAIAPGDFNGDSRPDLAVLNSGSNSVTILLGTGSGGFTMAATSPATGNSPSSIAAGDFNNDGRLDLAVTNSVSNNVTILLGNGTFTAASTSPATGNNPSSVVARDFNGDNKLDLAVTNNGSSSVTILLGNGDGSFTVAEGSPATGNNPSSIAAGDFNNDGRLDLAVTNSVSNNVTILLGNGNGTFTAASTSPATGNSPSSVAVGDINNDGKADLAVANNGSSTVTILLGDGNGNFTPAATNPGVGNNPSSVAIGDLNGDSKLDLAVANNASHNITILLGDGAGGFNIPPGSPFSVGNNPSSVVMSDLNLDARLDLAVANSGSNNVTIKLNTCNTPPSITAAGPLSIQKGTAGMLATVATVSDLDDAAGSLSVTTISGGTATGITVSNLVNTNGTVTASLTADCSSAGSGTLRLQVTDSGGLTATATLTIDVTDNTAPVLGNYPATGPINLGTGTTVTPDAAPTDNGTLVSLTASAPGFTGNITANTATGTLTINNAGPAGNHTVTVTATDNCGATASKTFNLVVNGPPTIAGQSLTRQQSSAGAVEPIATVNDDLTSPGDLSVEITSSAPGISITDLTNTNGTITANVAAACTAAVGANQIGLKVTDGHSLTATANVTVNVTANSAPTLSYANQEVVLGGSLTISPSSGPADNGAVTSISFQSIAPSGFTGTITVGSNGVVSVSNAAPVGNYTVTVVATDNCGATTTAAFTLRVDRALRVVGTNVVAGAGASIPIELVAGGGESAIGFSLIFDTAVLSLVSTSAGSGLPGSAFLNVNTSQAAQGRLGIALALPIGQSFTPGTHQLVVVNFNVASNASTNATTISFGDQPIVRSVSDESAASLSAIFVAGQLNVALGFEADVTPRPGGKNNGTVTLNDWVQVARFAVGLDTANTANREFQRADCGPGNTLGDGRIDLLDVVQAGRYAAGLDPIVEVGGPSAPSSGFGAEPMVSAAARTARVVPAMLVRGSQATVVIELEAEGNENALSFSLSFDPAQLSYLSAAVGSGASGAALLVNANQATSGRVGILLALPAGQTLPSGARQVVLVTFAVAASGAAETTEIGFSNQPVSSAVADINANRLATSWSGAIFTLARQVLNVSAASYSGAAAAPEAIIAAFGTNLATGIAVATALPLPTTLAGSTVKVRDSAGTERLAPLFFVSPFQINYQVPPGTALGPATVTITGGDGKVSVGNVQIAAVAPSLFSADSSGQGVAAGYVVRQRDGVEQAPEPIIQLDAQGKVEARPIDLGPETDQVFLILYGTGIRHRISLAAVTVSLGGVNTEVLYAGPAPGFVGLDQINIRVPRSLAGRGTVSVVLTVDNRSANPLQVRIK